MLRRNLLLAAPPLFAQRPSRISVGCHTSPWPLDGGDFIASLKAWSRIRELGYTGIETSYRDVEKLFDRSGGVGSQLRRMGLLFYGVHLWPAPYDPATGLPPRHLIDRLVAGAAQIGAERLVLTGQVAPDFEHKLATLKSIEAHCRRLSLRLAYHHQAAELNGPDPELPRLMKKARDVEFLLDWSVAHQAGLDLPAFFKQHRSAITAMHFRHFRGAQPVPLGQGDLDYAPLAQAIRKANWSGWVLAAEPHPDAAASARAYLRQLLGA